MTGSGNEITQLAEEFASCRRTLLALGDENRQHLILEMMQMKDCRGVRVGYSFRPDCEEIDALLCMLQHAKQMMRQLPSQEVAE